MACKETIAAFINGMRLVDEFTDNEGEQTVVYAITRKEWQTLL